MNSASAFNLDKFRNKFESEEHWNLRLEFMQAHKDKFSEDRLLCLAQIFLNIQVLRCTYSENIMKQIAELSIGIGNDYKADEYRRLKRTLLNATDVARERFTKEPTKDKINDSVSDSTKLDINSDNFVLISEKELYPIENFSNSLNLEPTEPCEVSGHLEFCKDEPVQFCNTALPLGNSSFESYNLAAHIKSEPVDFEDSSASLKIVINPREFSSTLKIEPSENNSEYSYAQLDRKLRSDSTFTLKPEELSNRELQHVLNNWNCYNVLDSALAYAKLKLHPQCNQDENTEQWACRLTVQIGTKTWMLGSFVGGDCRMVKHFAARDAIRMIISKCVPIKANSNYTYSSHADFASINGSSNPTNMIGTVETTPPFMHTVRNKMLILIQEVLKIDQSIKHLVKSPLSPEVQEANRLWASFTPT